MFVGKDIIFMVIYKVLHSAIAISNISSNTNPHRPMLKGSGSYFYDVTIGHHMSQQTVQKTCSKIQLKRPWTLWQGWLKLF